MPSSTPYKKARNVYHRGTETQRHSERHKDSVLLLGTSVMVIICIVFIYIFRHKTPE